MIPSILRTTYLRGIAFVNAAYRIGCISAVDTIARLLPTIPQRILSFHPSIITPEFLTHVLRTKGLLGPDDQVVSCTATEMEGGNIGRMSRITLTYRQQEERAPPSTMICKCFGTRTRDSFVAAMIPLARNENLAYTDEQFVNLMQGLQPAVYYCSVSHFGLGFILMEDLSVTNRTKKSRDGVTLEELGMMWTAAARLHSRTLGMSSQALERISHMFEWTGPLFDEQIKSAVNLLSGPWETRLRPYPRLLHAISQLQNVELVNQLHVKLRGFDVYSQRPRDACPTPFCAIVHGDARVDNCFFNDASKTVRFVDWQTVALRSPMQDIGWSLIDGGANAMHMPPIELLTALKTSNSPISTDDSKRVADAAARCRESIFHLIETRYLKVLEQERSEPRNVSGGLSNGVVPSLSYCQEMLPWTVFFCVMTFAGSCGGGVVVEDPTNPVTMTFSAYMARIEWMLCVFVEESFWTPSR